MRIPDVRNARPVTVALAIGCCVSLLLLGHVQPAHAAQAMATVSGQVVDLEGEGVPNAKLRVEDPERGFSREIETREDGTFTMRTIPPGSYTIIVEKEGYDTYQGQVNLQAGAEMRGVEVTLAAPTPEAEAAVLFEEGIEAYEAGDFDAAIEAFEQILETMPDSFEAHANLAQAYLGAGRWEEAVPPLEKAVELDPTATGTQLRLALTYSHLGRYDDAETVLKCVLGDKPDLQDPLMLQATIDLGNVYFADNRFDEAAAVFESALEVQPESAAALLGLGKCHLRAERYDEALELFEKVVAVAPDSPEAREAQPFIDALQSQG